MVIIQMQSEHYTLQKNSISCLCNLLCYFPPKEPSGMCNHFLLMGAIWFLQGIAFHCLGPCLIDLFVVCLSCFLRTRAHNHRRQQAKQQGPKSTVFSSQTFSFCAFKEYKIYTNIGFDEGSKRMKAQSQSASICSRQCSDVNHSPIVNPSTSP